MFRRGEISTEVDRGPFFFSLAAFIGSATAAALLFTRGGGDGLAVFGGVLLAIVAIAACAVLFAMVTDRAYISEGKLHMSYLFKKASVSFEEIGRISYKDDVYTVYGQSRNVIGTINAKLTGVGRVISELDRKGVRFE